MTNAEYWEKRSLRLQDNLMKIADEFIPDMEKAYRNAYLSMEKDIELFYLTFAKIEGMTLIEAKRMLTGSERTRFQMNIEEYIQKGIENGVSANWMKELESASDLYHISRLRALQMQLFQQIELLEAYKENGLKKTLKEIYQEGYYHSIFDYQQFTEIGTSFTKLDTPLINQVLAKPWTYDGETFSTRIWKDKEALKHSLNEILTQGLIRGESSNKIAKKIAKETNVSLSSANRLVVTEAAAFSTQASMDSFQELDVEEIQFLAALDEKTCVECGAMDGIHFPRKEGKVGSNLPPLHPRCRCVVVPFFEEGITGNEQRTARDQNGKEYDIPANMTYQEWKKNYVDNNPEYTLKKKKWDNRFSDKRQYDKYVEALGEKSIGSFEEFQKLKYNNKEWEQFKNYAKGIRTGEITPLADFNLYKQVSKEIDDKLIGITTSNGIEINGKSNHFIARVIGSVEQKRNGVSVDNCLKVLTEKQSEILPTRLLKNGRSQKFRYNGFEISINPDTGNLIQANPRRR